MMLHDIQGTYSNHYQGKDPRPCDRVLSFSGSTLLIRRQGNEVTVPTVSECGLAPCNATYLFSIDDCGYFLDRAPDIQQYYAVLTLQGQHGIDAGQSDGSQNALPDDFSYQPLGDFRWMHPRDTRFAVEVGWQLSHWYADNRFCGRCGAPTISDRLERMLRCPNCGNMIYPKISPGIIVGIIDGDRLLLTRYAGRSYRAWALVAGFTEIGEPLEDTVRREAMEEVGLHVKNITYYANQPWMRSASLLVGFFAEADGSREITVDRTELAEAAWVPWNKVPHKANGYSLTSAMMQAFYENHDHRERLIHL